MKREELKIFISYSNKDDVYFKLFKEGIESQAKSSQKLEWKMRCDQDIPIGSLWHEVIQDEIQDCNAAILLVSANFLSSDYIKYEEFVQFLERSEDDDLIFFPILLDDCDIKQWDNLPNRQFFSPKAKEYNVYNNPDTIIPYSRLVQFNSTNGTVMLNSYRSTYHKNCVAALEHAILLKRPKIMPEIKLNPKEDNLLLQIYKREIEEKHSKVKLLDKDIPIKDVYVDLSYEPFPVTTIEEKEFPKSCEELISKEQTENMVILGLPGAGKSTLLKYMLYRYNQNDDVVPIFVELKSDKDFKKNIVEYSDEVRMQNIRNYLEIYFEQILTKEGEAKKFLDFVSDKKKEFIFFCDGLDEISHDEYCKFREAINKVVGYNKHKAIISSREIGFKTADYVNFSLYSLSDFNKTKQIEYIEKHFKTFHNKESDRKNTLIQILGSNSTISQLAQSPILLYLLCITNDIKSINNKAQLFKNAIKILLKNRQILDDVSQNRLISFLKEIAVILFKLDKVECFEKDELDFYAKKFFCKDDDEICETLKGKYLDCGLFVQSKDMTYKFTHRTIWEYLVAEGMADREDKSEIYSRANMGLWEEPIKMYVTLKTTEIEEVLNGIWKENKALSLSCMRELGDKFPNKIFSYLYGNLSKRDKLRLIDTLRESYINASSEYSKRIVKIIKDTLTLIHKAEAEVKDCEVIYSYISFLEELKNKEKVFDELITDFLDLKNARTRRQRLCNEFGLSFINISNGNFEMGRDPISENNQNILFVDLEETPARQVKISKDFSMSQTLITNEMYYKSKFPYADSERLENNPYSDEDKQPVNKVNWYEAIIFAKWLGCTLPSEAEWEYACVGATQDREKFITPYKDKMKEAIQVACYAENSDNKTRVVLPVDRTKTNSLGLLDMLGNLREWCMDWYSDDFYNLCKFDEKRYPNFGKDIEEKDKVSYDLQGRVLKDGEVHKGDVFTFDAQKRCVDPVKKEPGKFEAKCLRGGCFDWNYTNLRPTYRNHNPANNVYKVNGFRLILKENENMQSELKLKMIDEKILNENIDKGIEEYTYNSVIITFDKDNYKYHFSIEKHFTIKSNMILLCYSSHIFANKFLFMDSEQSIKFYKENPLRWNDLNVKVSIFYQNIGDYDFSNEINNVKLKYENKEDNVIYFDIFYETIEGVKIPLAKGARIILKYNYSIPLKLWGNYMNRYVSYSNEPMFIKLKYGEKELCWKLKEILPDGTKENMEEGYGYKKRQDKQDVILEISKSKPLAQYRVKWDAEKYFGYKGLNTFDLSE